MNHKIILWTINNAYYSSSLEKTCLNLDKKVDEIYFPINSINCLLPTGPFLISLDIIAYLIIMNIVLCDNIVFYGRTK